MATEMFILVLVCDSCPKHPGRMHRRRWRKHTLPGLYACAYGEIGNLVGIRSVDDQGCIKVSRGQPGIVAAWTDCRRGPRVIADLNNPRHYDISGQSPLLVLPFLHSSEQRIGSSAGRNP